MSTLLGRLPKSPEDKTAAANGSNQVHGTLLQVLELLLAVRASGSDGQLSRKGSSASPRFRMQEDSAKDDEDPGAGFRSGSASSFSEELLSKQAAAVLELMWLADPALSRCPPIRHAMLRVIEVYSECTTAEAVKSALRIAQELNLSHETSWRIGSSCSSPSTPADRRVVPGRSLLLSAVAGAVIRRDLVSCLVGREALPKGDQNGAGRGGAGNSCISSLEALLPAKSGNNFQHVDSSVPPGVVGGVELRVGTGIGKDDEDVRQLESAMVLMSSMDVDVRDAVIKATKNVFRNGALRKAGALSCKGLLLVWASAAKSLLMETHPPNVRRLVRLLARVGVYLQGCCLPAPVDHLWGHLRRLCDEGGAENVHAGALEAMGVIVRLGEAQVRAAVSDEDHSRVVPRQVDEYVSLLELAVGSGQPVVTRAAAVASLASSGLLKTLASSACTQYLSPIRRQRTSMPFESCARQGDGLAYSTSTACVRLWFVALSLLQDEEQSVRTGAARACADAATGPSSSVEGAVDTEGARVDLCAVDFALAHMARIAVDMGDDALTRFCLGLMQMLADILAASCTRDPVNANACWAGAPSGGDRGKIPEHQHMDERHVEDGDDDMIFGHEERNGLQEPTLFASIATPYLRRALVALDSGDNSTIVLPGVVMRELTNLLNVVAASILHFRGPARTSWQPAVYHSIIASSMIGAAVLAFVDSRDHRPRSGEHTGNVGQLLGIEIVRASKTLGDVEATLTGNESVHPGVLAGIALCPPR